MSKKHRQTIPICFDLDHTLLDTRGIRKDFFTIARHYKCSTPHLMEAYRNAVRKKFTPLHFVVGLGLSKRDQKELLGKIWTLLSATRKFYVYPGIQTLLARLMKIAPLYLVTHGDDTYQRVKLQQSGLAHYFSRVLVTPHIEKKKILQRLFSETGGRILLIDDSHRVYASAREIGVPIIKARKSWKDKTYFDELYYRILEKLEALF